jgi:Na+/melibiose symporter-like transporter
MPPTSPARRSTFDLIVLNAYWIGLSFMWNSLHLIILPAVLLHLSPETQKNTYLGLLTLTGLLIAMFVQPISGSWSDRWASRWGRRRPLILLGTLFDFVFLAFLAWSGGLTWVAIGYIGLQFSSNIAHGPLQGLLPDQVPTEQHGQASSLKNLMDMGGLIAASLVMGQLLKPEVRHPVGVISLIAAVLAVGALITLMGVHERPAARQPRQNQADKDRSGLLDFLRVDWSANRVFLWLIVARFFFLEGVYGIQSFAQYFVQDVLAVPNPIQLTGNLLAAITLALTVFAFAGGWLGDRLGHARIAAAAGAIGSMGCLLLVSVRTPTTLLIFGSIVGVGIGLFLTANWAQLNQSAPMAEAGKFLGLTNLATAGAAVLGRLQGPGIDLLNNAYPGEWRGYMGLFLLSAVFIFASIFFSLRSGRISTATGSV